jgi:hypothetical protein
LPGSVSEKAIRVEGLRELERAFKLYGRGMEKGLREALTAASEPVAAQAQTLALSSIRRMSLPWSRVRIGVTRRTAYIVPQERGRNTKRLPARWSRPNLTGLLLDRAYEPALEANIKKVEREIGDALDDLARMWSRV